MLEKRFREHPGTPASLERLAAAVDKRTRFGNMLLDRLKTNGAVTSAWFVDAATRNNICRDRDLSEFALRLANDEPLVVAEMADHSGLEYLIGKLIDNPAILRAARLLTLVLHSASEGVREAT